MGRELKRVALDFSWPLHQVWEGFINHLGDGQIIPCALCNQKGITPEAQHLQDLWYGNIPFDPVSTGSQPFPIDHPVIQARARANVERSPSFYGTTPAALNREAQRLADLFNSMWCHHLDADDVAVLLKKDRLWDLTRTPRTEEQKQNCYENGWTKESNGYLPTPQEVNE